MPKATQGRPYTVVKGDNLSKIARQAYGDPRKWRLLWKANQHTLRSDDPDLIFPNEVLQIPGDPDTKNVLETPASDEYIPGKDPIDFTIVVGGAETPIQSGRIKRTMDTVTDGFAVEFPWNPDDPKSVAALKPYQYNDVQLYLGGYLVLTGRVYATKPALTDEGSMITLEGFSPTADLADSTIKPPLSWKKLKLKQHAINLIEPFGLKVHFDADEGDEFKRVTAGLTETVFEHLLTLAKQRSVLISSNIKGEPIFYQAQIGESVGILEEGMPPCTTLNATFDGRQRFSVYRIVGRTPKKSSGRNAIEAVAKDDSVPRTRFTTERAEEVTKGNIQEAADWARSKQVAEALTIECPVTSWYDPKGRLWRENTIVTLKSKTLFVPDGFDFLIRSVEYTFDDSGTKAVLSLVPPQVYTGKPIEEPWL